MFYAVLRDLTLYFHKDETGVKLKASHHSLYESLNNAIRIHHAMSSRANDYAKRSNVFRLATADRSEYLFQARYLFGLTFLDSRSPTHAYLFNHYSLDCRLYCLLAARKSWKIGSAS
jgi:hypothetical protein